MNQSTIRTGLMLLLCGVSRTCDLAAQVPVELQPWLAPQSWQRDVAAPVLTLGQSGEFDDTHLFAPTVARDEAGRFLLWYCGSQGFAHDLAPTRMPDERHFRLGLAKSPDGKAFVRSEGNPVFQLDRLPRLSILTPTVLRRSDGTLLREDGRIRMWFSSATLGGSGQSQSVQDMTSEDGITWTQVSPLQLTRAYAPSVLKTEHGYQMWYTQPGRYPWVMRHATSRDGRDWTLTERPVLEISQDWEHDLQIYPCVLEVEGTYLMWYSSYLDAAHQLTGIGFAVSRDGVSWHKHPENPVLRPDPSRPWESHYVSSHSVMRLPDGTFRIWYASRKAPPFTNLYFAINTATWDGKIP